ncbi:MAG: hypothetical protein DRO90_03095, partial [Candidatus Altiarchaeales archaeon]
YRSIFDQIFNTLKDTIISTIPRGVDSESVVKYLVASKRRIDRIDEAVVNYIAYIFSKIPLTIDVEFNDENGTFEIKDSRMLTINNGESLFLHSINAEERIHEPESMFIIFGSGQDKASLLVSLKYELDLRENFGIDLTIIPEKMIYEERDMEDFTLTISWGARDGAGWQCKIGPRNITTISPDDEEVVYEFTPPITWIAPTSRKPGSKRYNHEFSVDLVRLDGGANARKLTITRANLSYFTKEDYEYFLQLEKDFIMDGAAPLNIKQIENAIRMEPRANIIAFLFPARTSLETLKAILNAKRLQDLVEIIEEDLELKFSFTNPDNKGGKYTTLTITPITPGINQNLKAITSTLSLLAVRGEIGSTLLSPISRDTTNILRESDIHSLIAVPIKIDDDLQYYLHPKIEKSPSMFIMTSRYRLDDYFASLYPYGCGTIVTSSLEHLMGNEIILQQMEKYRVTTTNIYSVGTGTTYDSRRRGEELFTLLDKGDQAKQLHDSFVVTRWFSRFAANSMVASNDKTTIKLDAESDGLDELVKYIKGILPEGGILNAHGEQPLANEIIPHQDIMTGLIRQVLILTNERGLYITHEALQRMKIPLVYGFNNPLTGAAPFKIPSQDEVIGFLTTLKDRRTIYHMLDIKSKGTQGSPYMNPLLMNDVDPLAPLSSILMLSGYYIHAFTSGRVSDVELKYALDTYNQIVGRLRVEFITYPSGRWEVKVPQRIMDIIDDTANKSRTVLRSILTEDLSDFESVYPFLGPFAANTCYFSQIVSTFMHVLHNGGYGKESMRTFKENILPTAIKEIASSFTLQEINYCTISTKRGDFMIKENSSYVEPVSLIQHGTTKIADFLINEGIKKEEIVVAQQELLVSKLPGKYKVKADLLADFPLHALGSTYWTVQSMVFDDNYSSDMVRTSKNLYLIRRNPILQALASDAELETFRVLFKNLMINDGPPINLFTRFFHEALMVSIPIEDRMNFNKWPSIFSFYVDGGAYLLKNDYLELLKTPSGTTVLPTTLPEPIYTFIDGIKPLESPSNPLIPSKSFPMVEIVATSKWTTTSESGITRNGINIKTSKYGTRALLEYPDEGTQPLEFKSQYMEFRPITNYITQAKFIYAINRGEDGITIQT